jgi:type IV secretory pathway TraG/TraD family ATPase VirD4
MTITIFLLNLALSLGVGVYLWGAWLGNPLLGAADGAIVAGAAAWWVRLHQAGEEWRQLYQSAFWWLNIALCSGIGAYIGGWFGYQTIGGLAGAALMLVFVFGAEDDSPDHGGVFGIARWAKLAEMLKAGVVVDPDNGVWLGLYWTSKGKFKLLAFAPKDALSLLLCAVPGAGKFTCSIAPTLLSNGAKQNGGGQHCICFDPKGQAASVTGGSIRPGAIAWRQRLGRVVVINSFDILPGQLLPSSSVNPLADIDPDSGTAEAQIKTYAAILVPVREGDNQPFFAESGQEQLKGVMLHLRIKHGKACTFITVNDAIQQHEIELNKLYGEMCESPKASVRNVGNRYYLRPYEKTLPDGKKEIIRPVRGKEDHSIISTVQNGCAFLADGPMVKLFGGSGPFYSFKDLTRPDDGKRDTVYIVWPATKPEYAKASELLITSGLHTIMDHGRKKPGVLFIVDEFANALQRAAKGGGVAVIGKAFSYGRDAGLRVMVVLQTWGQLVSMLPEKENANEMFGAAGARIFYGSEDPTTDKVIIDAAFDTTIWGPARKPFVPRKGGPMDGHEANGETAKGVPFLRADQLRAMKANGGLVAFFSGLEFPCGMQRFPHYFQIKELADRADPDPYHE